MRSVVDRIRETPGNYKAKETHGGYVLVIGVFVSLPAQKIIRL
jgi:hypothetical protein